MEKYLENIDRINVDFFQKDLIDWFKAEQRELPWRQDRDPYKVWVSEIMLQQTRVDTVIPYFNRFIERFPTLEDLAAADEEKLLKAWEGLGYYSRARNLQCAVQEVQEKYQSIVPQTPEEIPSLKGVGPYTAGAILSIAYGLPEPAVDGNVMRVLSRILMIFEDIAKASTRKIFEEGVRRLISHSDPSSFNQALMELGALICTPASPSCLLCPVREHCLGFQNGVEKELPVKTKKTKQREVRLAAMILTNPSGKMVIHKRPSQGLLANLWEFPTAEILLSDQSEKTQMVQQFQDQYKMNVQPGKLLGSIDHTFSHLIWRVNVYTGVLEGGLPENGAWNIVDFDEMEHFSFPVPYQKMRELYIQSLTEE